ncbi:MAG TPA: hypothetical protein VL093_11470 [Flavipsychrobacter sp.]|jgi:hypothetical protein|nr:hypothetical protein [Flavipsychrobacter sp.]
MIREKELLAIVKRVRGKITPESETGWNERRSIDEVIEQLNREVMALEGGDVNMLQLFNLYFAPTGFFQELAMANGWSDDYMQLSTKWDELYSQR